MEKTFYLTTPDGERIHLRHRGMGAREEVIILAHGLLNHKEAVTFKQMEKVFARSYDVISFDFRGHGASSGRFSWTASEPADLRTVIAYAVKSGYKRIGIIGFSLGAAVALIEAAENRAVTSLISVSAPSSFWKIDFCFWEKEMLKEFLWNLGPGGKGKGMKPGHPFQPKIKPLDAVSRMGTAPVLFIHGGRDWLIKPHHGKKLFEKTSSVKELAVFPEAGHAEMIFEKHPQKFERICLDWFAKTLKAGT